MSWGREQQNSGEQIMVTWAFGFVHWALKKECLFFLFYQGSVKQIKKMSMSLFLEIYITEFNSLHSE